MFRVSNTLFGILNVLALLLGLAAMGGSTYIYFHAANGNNCQRVLEYPLLFGGFCILVVSILAIVGVLCRFNGALYLYLLITFVVILGFVLFTVFALFVTNKKVGNQFKVGDFSLWLQDYVINDRNWDEVKSCLVDARVCRNFAVHGGPNDASFLFKQLSTTQLGCCKPPVQCGFTMKNATFWEMPKMGPAVKDSDCMTWNNRLDKLCYDCNSCKGGVLANIRKQWRHLTIFNVCVLILVTFIYVLGCYSIRNNRVDSKYGYY